MPARSEKKIFPYSPAQVFDLVADIESYPAFVPWCKGATILESRGTTLTADLVVGGRRFSDNFRSLVTLEKPRAITVAYGGGALERLTNTWTFTPSGDGGCEVAFHVDFKIRSPFLNALMETFFDKAFNHISSAFEDRARTLYG